MGNTQPSKDLVYVPFTHPGTRLLPPSELLKYDSLPQSIQD